MPAVIGNRHMTSRYTDHGLLHLIGLIPYRISLRIRVTDSISTVGQKTFSIAQTDRTVILLPRDGGQNDIACIYLVFQLHINKRPQQCENKNHKQGSSKHGQPVFLDQRSIIPLPGLGFIGFPFRFFLQISPYIDHEISFSVLCCYSIYRKTGYGYFPIPRAFFRRTFPKDND